MPETPAEPIPQWRLETFDREGKSIAMIVKLPNGPPTLFGDHTDLLAAIGDLRKIPNFFLNPDHVARETYDAFRSKSAIPMPEWEDLLPCARTPWIAAANTAATSNPSAN